MKPIALEGGVGSASALKMAFGGWNKIGSALMAQAYAIARAYGVRGSARRQKASTVRASFVRHARRGDGRRRWKRSRTRAVRSACRTGMGRGAAELFSRWDAHRDRPAERDQLLDDLTDA